MSEHPSEEKLQQFASGQSENDLKIKMHVSSCHECNAAVTVYRLLFSTIQQQEKPGFDFDISGLVLKRIQAPQTTISKDNLVFYVIAFAAICLSGTAFYWYREVLSGALPNFGSLFIALLAATAIITLIFLLLDLYKTYQQKIKALDFC